jgi:MFS transporter, FSR family, fosmidomycin resistance protein
MRSSVAKSGPDAAHRPVPHGGLFRPGLAVLLAALAVEFADELVDGAKSAAMPLIRHDLSLSYVQIGLLGAVPLIAGSILELPVGVLSGTGARRRRVILSGGLVFVAAVLGAGLARSFTGMLIALVVFFPASGAFVSLTQSALMDAAPDRQAQHMARWTLAGSAGAGAGSLLVAAVLGAGGSWRLAFIMVAGCGLAAWLGVTAAGRTGMGGTGAASGGATADDEVGSGWPGWREAAIIVRRSGALRWLALLEISDLLLDVLTAFLALYLVAVAHASPAVAAVGIAIRLGAGLLGDVILIQLLERFSSRGVLRASAAIAGLLFPAFLLAPGLGPKLALLAGLTIATAPWYPVVTAELFGSLSGHSGLAVSLSSAAGLVGGLGPLAVGLLAQHLGLSWAMTALCLVPVAMLAVPGGRQRAGPSAGPDGDRDASARLGCRG